MKKVYAAALCLLIIVISTNWGHWIYDETVNQAVFISRQQKTKLSLAESKVSEEEARNMASKIFIDFFPQNIWEMNNAKYKIISSELRMISYSWKNMIPFYKEKPRIAWFIEITIVPGNWDRIVGMTVHSESIIVLDAITNKLICKQMNILLS